MNPVIVDTFRNYLQMPVNKNNRILWFYITQEGKCFYCLKVLFLNGELVNCNIDHKIPSSRGGKDSLENTCLACVNCNTEKGAMTVEEYTIAKVAVAEGRIKKKDLGDYLRYLDLQKKFGSVDKQMELSESPQVDDTITPLLDNLHTSMDENTPVEPEAVAAPETPAEEAAPESAPEAADEAKQEVDVG